jgi:phenylalanyl-tRNA synthetase alpha chain
VKTLNAEQLEAALACRDLTDPATGPHAVQLVVQRIEDHLSAAWGLPVRRDTGPRVVSVADNYDALGYTSDAITRDSRYTRYCGAGTMLRSHTTARIPQLLPNVTSEIVLSVPGICYRRDSIDRRHTSTPHQLDVWRIRPAGMALTEADLQELAGLVAAAVLPGRRWWTVPSRHPYTTAGREIYVEDEAGPVEIGECGLAHPRLLAAAGLAGGSGLAMGLGLDRLVMLAKHIPDIRLLRSDDPRVAGQMLDLAPYQPVSRMPGTTRDLSLAIASDMDLELIGDQVREDLGPDADAIEDIQVMQRTAYEALPEAAIVRMGMRPGQDNVLLRLILRHPTRTLTGEQANAIRDLTYRGLHQGTAHEWTVSRVGLERSGSTQGCGRTGVDGE